MENIGKDYYDPELESRDRAVLVDLHDVFYIDALGSSLPISTEVDNPDYDMTFSRLSYGKGNCLIRMIENMITLEAFNNGVQTYLKQLSYENADRFDLWNYLNAAAQVAGTLDPSLNLTNIMEGYTSREGYPVVSVSTKENGDVALSQKQFLLYPDPDNPSDYTWYIPINFEKVGGTFDQTSPQHWMREDGITVSPPDSTYIINVKETGYYRVNYDNDNWQALTQALYDNHLDIDRLNRAQLIDDSFALARAGELEYTFPMRLSAYLISERDYIPIKAGFNSYEYLDLIYRDQEQDYVHLQGYMTNLFGQAYMHYGFDPKPNEVYLDALSRAELITWMCLYDYQDCIQRSKGAFQEWMDEADPDANNPIPVDLKQPIYDTAIRNGGQTEWDFLFNRFSNCAVDGERRRMIYGLGSSEDQSILEDYLFKTVDPNGGIRSQDTRYVYRAVGASRVGRTLQFYWLDANFVAFSNYHGINTASQVNEIVTPFAAGAKIQEEVTALENFYLANQGALGGSASTINQALNTMYVNMAWSANNYVFVMTILRAGSGLSTTTTTPTTTTTTTTTTTNVPVTSTTTKSTTTVSDTTTTPTNPDDTTTTNAGDSTTTVNPNDSTTTTPSNTTPTTTTTTNVPTATTTTNAGDSTTTVNPNDSTTTKATTTGSSGADGKTSSIFLGIVTCIIVFFTKY